MSRFKQAMIRFFAGRYGVDSLYRFCFVLWLILAATNMFVGSKILYVLELLVMFWMFFRCFSKNIVKRSAENQKYLAIVGKIKDFFRLKRNKWRDRKTHSYRKCPSCHATLRFPKVKGEHDATCPRCKNPFHFKI